jgi:hypothetical protein
MAKAVGLRLRPGHGDQRLDFRPCQDEALVAAGAQCAAITVPLDYRNPNGTTIDVAVSRLAARDSARRHGVLLFNPVVPVLPAWLTRHSFDRPWGRWPTATT